MSVSIYDIAKKAGVSPSTVSRALENHPRIGAATRKRIQEMAVEMNYIPSTVAKSLATKKTWTIGMVLAGVSDPFMGRVVEGVEQVALENGFNVFISTSQNDLRREIAVIETLQKRQVDGILIISTHLFGRSPRFFEQSKVPVVLINEQNPDKNMHFVSVDDVREARLAVEHLIALGHRRIGYVSILDRPQSNQHRFKGYQDALEAAGIAVDPALIFSSYTIEDRASVGEASLEPLLAVGATSVFCYNDAAAIGLLAACHKRGISVPDKLSIMGFDDIDMAAYTMPQLTTIRQPRFELGHRAMQMMLDLLNGQEPENQILPCELVVRQTTAQPVVLQVGNNAKTV
jgi:DNA-binding LacI/PurR family transcriptional regulator